MSEGVHCGLLSLMILLIIRLKIMYWQTLKLHLWNPNLEIYGLEHVVSHQVFGEMAGLRIAKNKTIKYDSKFV